MQFPDRQLDLRAPVYKATVQCTHWLVPLLDMSNYK